MFSGTGYQIHGGTFYSVGGDVNLQSQQHLTIQDHHAPPSQLEDSGRVAGFYQQLATRDHELPAAAFESSAGITQEPESLAAWPERQWTGVERNSRYGMASRPAPYDLASLRHRSGPSSSDSRALVASSSGPSSTFPLAPQFNYSLPSTSSSFPCTDTFPPTPNAQCQYPAPYPPLNGSTALTEFSTASDQNHLFSYLDFEPTSPVTDYGLPSSDQERQQEANVVSDLEPFHPGPTQSIHGATFITAQNVNHNHGQGEMGLNILHRAVALEALYDSADSFPQPRCHPETRVKMLDDLYNWAIEDNVRSPICWLHGPAGAGKSAVMQTLCQKLQNAGRLGGAFFFKRGHPTRGHAKVLFATLAYQLALNNRNLSHSISRSAEYDPSVVGRQMEVQLRTLVVEPCISLGVPGPSILLIDGLDECQDEGTQREIIYLIGNAAHQHSNTFRILVASRPEAHIREVFMDEPLF
ncbi:hypothetical protein B0H13DRAFT_2197795, partial [Mycena leptocephala]